MSLTPLRISSKKLLSRIREAAESSSNIVFVPPLERRSMAGMMNFHAALRCLQEGTMVGAPKQNANGDWDLWLERGSFSTKVIASCRGARVSRIVVCVDREDS